MSDDPPRLATRVTAPRARLVVVLAACAAVVLVGTSILNRSRWTLACEDGELVAYRGLSLPFGRARLDPDAYPAVAVPPVACEDVVASSREQLEEHYVAATMHRIDKAIRSDSAVELESAAQVVDRLVGSPEVGGVLDERKRALVVALLRADLRTASTALGRARGRLRAAEEVGVADEVLRALQHELDDLCSRGLESTAEPEAIGQAEQPPAGPEFGTPAPEESRAL